MTGAKSSRSTRIQSVSRAASALFDVANHPAGATGSELARRLGLAQATAFHLLSTLVDVGLLSKHDRRYYLGPAVGALATAFHDHGVIPRLAEPLQTLVETTEETAYLVVWRHGEMTIAASREGSRAIKVRGPDAGEYDAPHARAAGKVLLAHLAPEALDAYLANHPRSRLTANTITAKGALKRELETVRVQGYATDLEEYRDGVSCVSMPIRFNDAVVGAYTIAAPAQGFDEVLRAYLEALKAAIEQVTGS